MLFDTRQAVEIGLGVLLGAAIGIPPIASAQRVQSQERQVAESDRGLVERVGQTQIDAPPERAPLDPGEQRRIIEGLQQEISAAELAGGPNDMQAAPILRETADRRMDVLRRYIAGEFPPEIVLGCYYEPLEGSLDAGLSAARGEPRQCNSGSKRHVERRLLSEARSYYAEAIRVILRNEQYSNDELEELESELIRSSYEFGSGVDGKASLRRLLAYQVANSAPMLERIDTLVQMADWDLLYAHRVRATQYAESALQVYEQAYRQLEESGVEQTSIDRLFAPQMPVAIPIFEPNPLTTEQTSNNAGYIDVAFDITRYGRGEHIEILDTTTSATRAAEKDLIRSIEQTSFRPRSTDGGFGDSSRVVVRYYLTD